MNDITVPNHAGLPTQFSPENSYNRQSQFDSIIAHARRMKDWPLLEDAVDQKIAEQQDFVRWWDANVRGKGERANVTDSVTFLFVEEAERLTGFDKMRVSRMRKRVSDAQVEKYRAQLVRAAWKKADPNVAEENHRAVGTGENEWYTPAEYIELARECMGGIDLDPATSAIAQNRIRAGKYFTAADDGLQQDWFGRVWLNPPYTQPHVFQFIEKLCAEYSAGNIDQAVCLTHNYTDTRWFHLAASVCDCICLTRGRIGFTSPTGEIAAPTQGQAFFYFGSDRDRFAKLFSSVGVVFHR